MGSGRRRSKSFACRARSGRLEQGLLCLSGDEIFREAEHGVGPQEARMVHRRRHVYLVKVEQATCHVSG
ncbi:unnamed protein product [Symbiodinium necroappetens]|uniref:Uncharacterized protein n=1 Tax=Symbiodinium necroappetens TaxID=1628268 RepID=A0A812ZYB7_9DINO|nr:unnamed protein product [Symbiodinium necroappetens]